MDTNLPECAKLKLKYHECYDQWKANMVVDLQLSGLHVCTSVFEDYRDCVTEGMKARVASVRRKQDSDPNPGFRP